MRRRPRVRRGQRGWDAGQREEVLQRRVAIVEGPEDVGMHVGREAARMAAVHLQADPR